MGSYIIVVCAHAATSVAVKPLIGRSSNLVGQLITGLFGPIHFWSRSVKSQLYRRMMLDIDRDLDFELDWFSLDLLFIHWLISLFFRFEVFVFPF